MMFHALRTGFGQTPADFSASQSASDVASAPPEDCDSTKQVCHWYCYIPFMATPDCLASFQGGVTQIAQGATSAASGIIGAAAGGVAQGVSAGITQNLVPNTPSGIGSYLIIGAAAAGLLLIVLAAKK